MKSLNLLSLFSGFTLAACLVLPGQVSADGCNDPYDQNGAVTDNLPNHMRISALPADINRSLCGFYDADYVAFPAVAGKAVRISVLNHENPQGYGVYLTLFKKTAPGVFVHVTTTAYGVVQLDTPSDYTGDYVVIVGSLRSELGSYGGGDYLLRLSEGAATSGTTRTFFNAGRLAIPSSGVATPYGGTIIVNGMPGVIKNVQVKLNGVSHTNPDDLDILLVSPSGVKLLLMSDAGGVGDLVGTNLTFDQAAASSLPDSSQIASGNFKPSNFGVGADTFPAPAPAAPFSSALTALNGVSANGNWRLFVLDDTTGGSGRLTGGWSLTITTGP